MYVLKGFINNALLVNNQVGVTATIGEVSTESLTYSREKGRYVSAGIDDLSLISFLSKQDGVLVPATANITTEEKVFDHVLKIGQFVYNKTILSSAPMMADELLQDLITNYDAVAEGFECGEIITDGRYYMPQWLSWRHKSLGENQIKVWFIDEAFRSQYDEYEIVVVPPFENLDDFFKTGAEVETLLKARALTETMLQIQIAKQGNPETVVRADEYDYVDPLNASHIVKSYWGLLIYGLAGNNVDAIKDALMGYILANSTHTKDEWTTILPDIFRRTEFILVPMWDSYAIPNRTLEAGIYSPIANLTSTLELIKKVIVGYSGSHINAHTSVMGHQYKSLNVLAVGGPENRNNWFKLTDIFPDYIDVPSTSLDFNRMSSATKNWSLKLMEMILKAEEMHEYSDVPIGMTKTTRDGILYLVYNYMNIHYLVAAKKNFPLPTV